MNLQWTKETMPLKVPLKSQIFNDSFITLECDIDCFCYCRERSAGLLAYGNEDQ